MLLEDRSDIRGVLVKEQNILSGSMPAVLQSRRRWLWNGGMKVLDQFWHPDKVRQATRALHSIHLIYRIETQNIKRSDRI